MSNQYKFSLIFISILILITMSWAQQTTDPREHNVGIDLGRIFRMGLKTGNGGTRLALTVLNGFVNVGVDTRKRPIVVSADGDRDVYDDEAQGDSDNQLFEFNNKKGVYVSVGR
ncbi:uncharacterized protein LOC128956178 [Oppia nitens]|uniref:uncharacterized protein LOC128956178 n=1 Tax=Oppia nitens TaxID=1686743 RepID=UPI0023DA766F|nr:uncharacterized protein LOC128956178 [Oppia nitens]